MAINFDMPQIYEGKNDNIKTYLYDIMHNLYAITTFPCNHRTHGTREGPGHPQLVPRLTKKAPVSRGLTYVI